MLHDTSFLFLHRESVKSLKSKQQAHTTKTKAKQKYKSLKIMKKLATTFGLLALMLIVTSFTTPEIGGTQGTPRDTGAGTGTPTYEIGGTQGTPRTPRDTGDGTSTGGTGIYEIGGTQGTPRGTGTGTGFGK